MLAILALLAQATIPPILPPRPQPTQASCWVSSCSQTRNEDGTEIAASCPLGSRSRMMTFDPADASKGDAPIVVCLCCPSKKVKLPPRVFEEKAP